MANTHRAIIENQDHTAVVIAAGTEDQCHTHLQLWLEQQALEKYQTAYVVEFRYSLAATVDEQNRLMLEDREHLTYETSEGLTVAEFIAALSALDGDMRVCLGYDGREPVTGVVSLSNTDGWPVVACPTVARHPEGRIPYADVDWENTTAPPGAETRLHPAVTAILRHFRHDHLPAGSLRDTSAACGQLAHTMAYSLPQDPELTAGLRHLLEGKDAFVRAAVVGRDAPAAGAGK